MLRVSKADYAERSAPVRTIARLAGQLADELNQFDVEPLRPAEIKRLLTGMSCVAGALTQILDELRASPVIVHAENDLALPARRSVLAELAQAAAAAEDLMVTTAGLSRVLPRTLSTVDCLAPPDR